MLKTLIILVLLALSCSQKKSTDSLVLCTSATYPPYESVDNQGNVIGFDIDIAKAIALQLKKKLEIKEMALDSLILGLKQDKCDFVLAGLSITPSRQKEITLLPYQGDVIKSYYLLSWKTAKKAKTIAVMSGSWMEDYVRKMPNVTMKSLESNTELLLDIQYQKSDAIFMEPHIAKEMLAKQPELKALEVALPESAWQLGNGIGIKKSNTQLARAIQNIVSNLKNSGTLSQLEKKWFHQQ